MTKASKLFISLLVILSILLSFYVVYAKQITGIVFEDMNKNLQFDPGEKGISRVMVSNQREVVATDHNGRYKISVDDETVIFITKPANYAVPLNEVNLPQFYYLHQPEGSPQLEYGGVQPTGKLPGVLNFPLFKVPESDTFEVIVFSDPQPKDQQEISFIRDDVIAELIGNKAVCGITLGDIVFDDLSLYPEYNQIIKMIGVPFYNVPGNHDQNYDAPDDQYALETFKRHFGPNYYSFDYGRVHFIVLDDVEYLGRDEKGSVQYQGKIGVKQLQWLKNDLSFVPPDRLIVLTMHIPLYTTYGDGAAINVVDRAALFEILKDRSHVLALAGHMHALEHCFIGKALDWYAVKPLHQVICATVSGSWWTGIKDARSIPCADQRDGTPNGYHIIRCEGNQYHTIFKSASQGKDIQLRISYPVGTIAQCNLLDTKIVVNVFDGSERSSVQFQVDDLGFQNMQQTRMRDPFYENIYNQIKDHVPDWISPDNSTHIWTAPLSGNLKSGVHKIIVKTVDQYGNHYQTAGLFVIE